MSVSRWRRKFRNFLHDLDPVIKSDRELAFALFLSDVAKRRRAFPTGPSGATGRATWKRDARRIQREIIRRAKNRPKRVTVTDPDIFVFPSAKTLADLKNELQNTQAKIEEKTLATARVIREIDTSTTVTISAWESKFTDQAQSARLHLESMYSPMVTNIADFQSRADQARSDYRKLVAEARQQIDDIRRGCLKHRTK